MRVRGEGYRRDIGEIRGARALLGVDAVHTPGIAASGGVAQRRVPRVLPFLGHEGLLVRVRVRVRVKVRVRVSVWVSVWVRVRVKVRVTSRVRVRVGVGVGV